MKLILLLLLITSMAHAQGVVDKVVNDAVQGVNNTTSIQNERKFAIIEYWPGTDSVKAKYLITKVEYIKDGSKSMIYAPGDTAKLFLPVDGSGSFKGSVTWKNALQLYDTTFSINATVDDPSTVNTWVTTNIAKQPNSGKPEPTYNKSFSYVSTTGSPSSAKYSWSGGRIEFYGEQYQGHGNVKILIDGDQVKTLFQGRTPYGTDFPRGIPSFRWTGPMGNHTIEFQTDAGNQYVIDMIRTFNYTTKPH